MRARMRFGIHLVHHIRSSGKVPDGETENDWWGGYPVCYGLAGVRHVRGDTQNSFGQAQTGMRDVCLLLYRPDGTRRIRQALRQLHLQLFHRPDMAIATDTDTHIETTL